MYLAIWISILVILIIIGWWVFGVYGVRLPSPETPSADFSIMLENFKVIPQTLWFRNNPCAFEILPERYHYIIYNSSGRVVYDSKPDEPDQDVTNTFEYLQAVSVGKGAVVRGNIQNLAVRIKNGDMYRVVHVSERLYGQCDIEY